MEIVFRSLNWQKTIWFLLLLFLSLVAMETESESSNGTVSPSSFEDEDWWKGAEDVDLTLHADSDSENDFLQVKNLELELEAEELEYWSELGFEEMECEDFSQLPRPPEWEGLHPPPLPPFLKEIGLLFEESWRRRALILSYPDVALEGLSDFKEELEHISEEGKCPLCEWSRGNNETLAILTRRPTETKMEKETSSTMIWALVGVALISASIGAVFMGLLLKCRRKDVITICNKTPAESGQSPPEGAIVSEESRNKMTGLRLALKNWRGNTSREASFDPYQPESLQNTYSESLYINGDSASTLYAEINNPINVDASPNTVAHYPSNTFSAAPDPLVSSSGLSVLYNKMPKTSSAPKDGTYANNAYVVSEVSSEPNESSGGSTSTPSSAYYSDVSTTVEIHSSKRKKKKRKADDRLGNIRFAQSVRIGNFPPPVAPPQLSHRQASSQESVPPSMHSPSTQFHSESSLEPEVVQATCEPPVLGSIPSIPTAPGLMPTGAGLIQTQTPFPSASVPTSRSCVHPVHPECKQPQTSMIQAIPVCPHCHGIYSEEMTLRSNAEVPVQRPLPPLPSRQMQGPRKKVVDGKVHVERTLSAVPSEYI